MDSLVGKVQQKTSRNKHPESHQQNGYHQSLPWLFDLKNHVEVYIYTILGGSQIWYDFSSVNFTSNPHLKGSSTIQLLPGDFSGSTVETWCRHRQGMFFLIKYHLLTCINPTNDSSCVGINIVSKMVWGSFTGGLRCLLQIAETATGLQRKKPPHLGSTYHYIHTEPAIMLNSKLVVTMCLSHLRSKKKRAGCSSVHHEAQFFLYASCGWISHPNEQLSSFRLQGRLKYTMHLNVHVNIPYT